jgi:hypothetical protein
MPSALAADPTQASPLAPQNAPPAPAQQTAAPAYDMTNYNAAMSQMQLNPQEQQLYQMHLSNLYGTGGVNNPDGSRSSLYQITANFDGQTYVIPTVWSGQILPPDQAIQMAKQYGLDKFPSYGSDQEAEARYQQMHGYMEKDTQTWKAQQ